jgi:hypothetical protein
MINQSTVVNTKKAIALTTGDTLKVVVVDQATDETVYFQYTVADAGDTANGSINISLIQVPTPPNA